MAGRSIDYTAHLKAEDDLTKEAEKAADALDKLESKGDVSVRFTGDASQIQADIENVIRLTDKVGGEAGALVLTSNAADVTNQIATLVLEVNKLDDPHEIDIKVDQIQALESGLGQISDKAKSVVAETGGMSSAMGNAFSNAAQDIAGLAGVTGSAGQAVGQLADQFIGAASGAGGLKAAMAGVGASLGPIAAISAAVWLVTSAVEAFNAPSKEAAALTKQMGEAMGSTADNSIAFADVMRENSAALSDFIAASNDPTGGFGVWVDDVMSKIPLIGGVFKEAGVNIFDSLVAAGESVHSFSTAVDKGGQSADDFKARLQAARDAGKISGDQFNAVSEAFDKYSSSAQDAAKASGAFAVGADEISGILAEIAAQDDPFSVMASSWDVLFKGLAEGTTNTQAFADAVHALSAELDMTPEEVLAKAKDHMADLAKQTEEAAKKAHEMAAAYDEGVLSLADLASQADSFASAMDQVNAASQLDFSQMAEDTVGSFDDMKDSLKGLKDVAVDWSTVDLSPDSVDELRGLPDELAKVTDGISGMRDSIQTELQAAFDTGGIDAYADKARFFAGEIQTQFPAAFKAAGASASDAQRMTNELLSDLQLMPTDIQIQIQMTREEEARAALDSFGSLIDKLEEPKQVEIRTMIAQGDIDGALATLNNELINKGYAPIVLPVDAEISAAVAKANEAQAYADSLVGTEAVDADIAAAQAAADEAKAHADSLTATMPLNADGTPAEATAAGVAAGIAGTTATMPLTADGTAATGEIAGVKSVADSTEGMVQIKADAEQAFATMLAINLITAAFAPPPVQITADGSSAVATAAATAAAVGSFAPIMSVGANPDPALKISAGAAAAIQSLKPIMSVFANPGPAILLGAIGAAVIQAMRPIMTVYANPGPAISAGISAASIIGSQRPNIPISAHLASYPSAASIAASIGTVRVPIDAYIRTMPRVNGAVP